ncbi:hypothetical protein GQ44DRAFT_691832 [Phaeosphaeriaceae sp. PMI808]|nr:hypothetical protein GQ44DRAFT_691832 [Phaeosphaeriaceae sp. PMI808]
MGEDGDGVSASQELNMEKFGQLLQKNYTKGELALKHAVGLGAGQNIIPITQPSTNEPPRSVEVGWHPVGGFAGKWFAEKTGLGKMITDKINEYPDPTQHWAVLVGDFAHQLWMDENFDVIYTNARLDRNEWKTFEVGETRFNDDALRRAGEAVIQQIHSVHPGYNLISNNCQTYVLQLLDAIKVSQEKEFGTTLAVYERLFGSGKVADLFVDGDGNYQFENSAGQATLVAPIEGQELGVIGGAFGHVHVPYHHPEALLQQGQNGTAEVSQGNSILFAQQVMNANTTQLNTQEQIHRGLDEKASKEHIGGGWGKKTMSLFHKLKE